MKSFFRTLLWMMLGLTAAACATAVTPTPNVETVPPASAATRPAESAPAQSVDRPYTPSDVSLVANTGRPQFLDSYADW